MASAGAAWLPVKPDLRGFGSEMDGEVQKSGSRAGGRFTDGFKRKLKVGAAIGAALAGAAAVNFMKGAVTQANNLAESVNAVNVTFGDNADGIHELGKTSAESLGLARSEFNGLAVQFSAFANEIAGKGGDVSGVMKDLTTRGADFASVMNLDVNEAMSLFQSGLAGETEPLRKFGIDLSAAAVESHAYAKGIANVGDKLTEGQKVQARYSLLMEKTSKTQGDFKNTSDGLANSQRILNAKWKDMQAQVGAKLLPVLADLSTWAADKGIPALEDFGEAIGDAAGFVKDNESTFKVLIGLIGGLVVVTKAHGVASSVAAAGGLKKYLATTKLISAALKVQASMQWLVNAAMKANPFAKVIAVLALLVAAVVVAYKKNETFRQVVQAAWKGIVAIFRWAWNTILQPIFKFFVRAIGEVMIMWGKMLRTLAKVPGFGWAKKAGDAMVNAGEKAVGLSEKIKKIPNKKHVKVTADTSQAVQGIASVRALLDGLVAKGNAFAVGGVATGKPPDRRASGGPVKALRPYRVGEVGEELFVPNIDGRIVSNSALRAMENRPMLRGATYGGGSRGGVMIAEGAIQQTFPATSDPSAAYAGGGGRVLDALSAMGV